MKKIIIIIFLLFVLVGFSNNNEMIRIRVLANSNSEYDQDVKKEVVKIVKSEFKEILKDAKEINEARNKINENLDEISSKVDTFLTENAVNYDYKINFGLNYFPEKKFNGKTFSEGYYESVLVTLGKGEGDNWWCILFPTVCLNGENTEYKSFFKNFIDRIIK